VTGEWWLESDWTPGHPKDVLTIIEAKNPYFEGNVILAIDEDLVSDQLRSDDLFGECEIDYELGRIKIINRHAGRSDELFYGLFAVTEAGEHATLMLEYQSESYPERFSSRAAKYRTRTHYARRNRVR
jgi:hypothetical protein